jgi:mannosylglucosylglycerate synthase
MIRKNIGFISTRFSGTDGVSLEASKWAQVLEKNGSRCFWFAGELDRDPEKSFLVSEAHFLCAKNQWINQQVLGRKRRNPSVTEAIHEIRSLLKVQLHCFINQFKIDFLIVENALTIPIHIPLGLALSEVIAETQIPTIAHHHDFYWERDRFSTNAVNDYLRMAFPPSLPNIKHVVINSQAQEQLALRTGISSIIIPNVLDFENPPLVDVKRSEAFRQSIGLKTNDKMILQPTRIIPRKGIEQAIELVKELKDPRYKLVISHEAGDEGFEYAEWLEEYALEHHVDLRMITPKIVDPFYNGNCPKRYSLWDIYPHADLITYPSLYEGFGNAFLEAIYFKKPILVNRYSIFIRDLEPRGFDLAVMDGFISKKTVQKVKEVLESPERRQNMVNNNYEVAWRHYSYSVLRNQFNAIINDFFNDHEYYQLLNELSDTPQIVRLNNDLFADPYDPLSGKIEGHMPN